MNGLTPSGPLKRRVSRPLLAHSSPKVEERTAATLEVDPRGEINQCHLRGVDVAGIAVVELARHQGGAFDSASESLSTQRAPPPRAH